MNYSKNCGSSRTQADLALEEALQSYSDHIVVSKNKDLTDGTVTCWVFLDTDAQSKLPDEEKAITHFALPDPLPEKEFKNYTYYIQNHAKVLHALLVKTGLIKPIN